MASNDASQNELSRLKAELALVTQSRDDFKAQLMKLAPQPSELKPPCYFLEMIPIEIRNQIYGELLLNPILGTVESLGDGSADGVYAGGVKYNLSPSIISACRQVRDEASEILYGKNTFFIACMAESSNWTERPGIEFSPFSRKWKDQVFTTGIFNFEKLSNYEKVQHWKVLISQYEIHNNGWGPTRHWSLSSLCHGLRHAAPKSLEIMIIPQQMENSDTGHMISGGGVENILKPLKALRNVGSLTIRSACLEDVRNLDYFKHKIEYRVHESDLPNPDYEHELHQLITGNSPVEVLPEMYGHLLQYARSFERYEPFKFEMGLDGGEGLETAMGKSYSRHARLLKQHTNPYRRLNRYHPVEAALGKARNHLNYGQTGEFKKYRSEVLTYLEPQYEQIVNACDNLTYFVKVEKRAGRLFDVNHGHENLPCGDFSFETYNCAVALDLLEEYANSFTRHLDFRTKAFFRIHQHQLDYVFNQRPREMALQQLKQMFVQCDFEDFKAVFKKACDDLDQQYLEIRMARRELFFWDISEDRGVDIDFDLQLGRCDEMINWDLNEPELSPAVDPSGWNMFYDDED
jgi:hypothetical protein